MKKLIVLFVLFAAVKSFSQETKLKEYIGVLTLTETYKDEKNWTEKTRATGKEHFQRLIKLKEEGVIVMAGRTSYETNSANLFGIVVFYAADDKAAEKLMQDDPAVKDKIMSVKVHPFGIAVSKCP